MFAGKGRHLQFQISGFLGFDSKRLCAWRKDIDMQGWLDSLLPCVSSLLWPGYKWDHVSRFSLRRLISCVQMQSSFQDMLLHLQGPDNVRGFEWGTAAAKCKRIINASSFYAVASGFCATCGYADLSQRTSQSRSSSCIWLRKLERKVDLFIELNDRASSSSVDTISSSGICQGHRNDVRKPAGVLVKQLVEAT